MKIQNFEIGKQNTFIIAELSANLNSTLLDFNKVSTSVETS
jgi:sialic acid synthase SpsE